MRFQYLFSLTAKMSQIFRKLIRREGTQRRFVRQLTICDRGHCPTGTEKADLAG